MDNTKTTHWSIQIQSGKYKAKTVCVISAVAVSLLAAVVIGIVFGVPGILPPPDTVIVNTDKLGRIKGKIVRVGVGAAEREVYEFYNVPYAVPPVGPLRFQPAELCSGDNCWEGRVFDATDNSTIQCTQTWYDPGSAGVSEDCLKLSIRSTNLTAAKPVVVWIHGGGLAFGYNGQKGYSFDTETTADLDLVTVNINYRLGYLGFNAWEETWNSTSGIYANNGIRDMAIALKWVNENVAHFGGDPAAVTIIGESGGGSAILCLLSSPLANDLFHNAWAMSPAPELRFDYKAGDTEAPNLQGYIPGTLGCTQDTIEERRECLLGLNATKFTSLALPQTYTLGKGWMDFPRRYSDLSTEYVGLVYTDPTVITQSYRALKAAPFTPSTKVKVILSNTAEEAAVSSSVPELAAPVQSALFPNMTYLKSTLTSLYKNITDIPDIVQTTVKTLYPGKSSQLVWDTLVTDLRQTCPNNAVAEAMSQSSHHQIYRLYISNSMQNAETPVSFHMWDTTALFGFKYFPYVPGTRDLEYQGRLRSILKNLAYGKVDEGWGTFPGETMEIGNVSPLSQIKSAEPQESVCDVFRSLGIDVYGAQN